MENNAKYQHDFVFSTSMSYADFLQAKQFEHSIRYAISDQTKALIATNEKLAEENVQVLQEVTLPPPFNPG